jgi:hypothetical protein
MTTNSALDRVSLSRRGFLRAAAVVAPVIILTPGLLMPVRKLVLPQTEIIQMGDFFHTPNDIILNYERMVREMLGLMAVPKHYFVQSDLHL